MAATRPRDLRGRLVAGRDEARILTDRVFNNQKRKDMALYTVNADGTDMRKLRGTVPPSWPNVGTSSPFIYPLGWDPDGTTLFYLWTVFSGDTRFTDWVYGDVYAISTEGATQPRRIVRNSEAVVDMTLSPDASMLAYVDWGLGGQIHLVDVATGSRRALLEPNDNTEVTEPTWLPNNSEIVFVSASTRVPAFALSTSRPAPRAASFQLPRTNYSTRRWDEAVSRSGTWATETTTPTPFTLSI